MSTLTQSSNPISPVIIETRPDGLTDVWMHRNIVHVDSEDGERWEADEIHFVSMDQLTVDQADEAFDELWAANDPDQPDAEPFAVGVLVEVLDEWVHAVELPVTVREVFQTIVLDRPADGVSDYVPPTGYHDAYLKDARVRAEDGKVYRATRDGATGVPGASPDWVQEAEGDEILPWEQRWAGSEYQPGEKVTHNGRIWEAERITAHEPGVAHSGWTDIGPV